MSIPKLVAGIVLNVAFYALLLFIPAGTLHWWRAWVFLAVTVGVMVMTIFSILPDNADLFSQRAKGVIQKGQPVWDRVLVILLVVSYVGQIVFIPLDVFRFHLMPEPGGLVSFLGLALYADQKRVAGLAFTCVSALRKTNLGADKFLRRRRLQHDECSSGSSGAPGGDFPRDARLV